MTDFNMALLAHWIITRLGTALVIAAGWPILVGIILAATDNLDSLWLAFLVLPATLIVFFKHGPFAWTGLIGFWIPAAAFGVWYLVMAWVVLRAVDSEAAQFASGRQPCETGTHDDYFGFDGVHLAL